MRVVVVAGSGKLGVTAFASACPLAVIHVLITDASPEESLADALAAANTQVVIAP